MTQRAASTKALRHMCLRNDQEADWRLPGGEMKASGWGPDLPQGLVG